MAAGISFINLRKQYVNPDQKVQFF